MMASRLAVFLVVLTELEELRRVVERGLLRLDLVLRRRRIWQWQSVDTVSMRPETSMCHVAMLGGPGRSTRTSAVTESRLRVLDW